MNQDTQHPGDGRTPEDKDPWTHMIDRAKTGYNAPPETPREAMWEAIQRRRRRRSRFGLIVGTPRVWIPAAAAAVLVVGFLAGRITAPAEDPGLTAESRESVPGSAGTGTPAGVIDDSAGAQGGSATVDADAAYRLAAASFLNRTETMLTRFQKASAPGSRGADADFAQWARGLLTETRLLIDSPAARDPEMARLLGDLETLLAQLVLLSDERQTGQRGWISDSMDRSGILLRVRNKIPNTVPYPGI